ncbi:MAG: hypothetical protein K2H75_06000 [Muribaculaceae bacterium]|nr:hypothetical protein [Muribaculaceae bacterium]
MSLSLTSRERLGALIVLALSLLLTAVGWWWRTRTQAEARAMAVIVTTLPTQPPYEAAAGNASHKSKIDSLHKDSLCRSTKHRGRQPDRKHSKSAPVSAYMERQPLDEPVEMQ